ncbi:mCG1049020, partial [Mus musculus]
SIDLLMDIWDVSTFQPGSATKPGTHISKPGSPAASSEVLSHNAGSQANSISRLWNYKADSHATVHILFPKRGE